MTDRWNYHVISNTHWDREWRYPFQNYRMALVEMMDVLLDLLERRPEYHSFFLDSQTVILEDYFQIRPENRERAAELVRAGRLQIGPWYTLPDQWCCPGEALVRNLLRGHRVASALGRVSKVGYTPFSNGQISQLPQIYQGFGIDSCFFYRGVGKHVAKSEFLWSAPDDSKVFGFRFGDYARYNYYFLVYRPGLLGRFPQDRAYDWNAEEIPFRVASDQSQDCQYGWMNQKLEVHRENLDKALEEARKSTSVDALTQELLYMMGHDHSFPAEEEIDLIKACQEHLKSDEALFHSSLEQYLKAFREKARDLDVLQGEMRHANKLGLWTNLFSLILSCRLYLKQRNARVSAQVLYGAEPLAVCAWLAGSPYPGAFLDVAWKRLLINQAHDAVGGCSVDRVHQEMLARWGEVETLSDELCRRSMRDLARRIDGGGLSPRDLQLTVFNTLPFERSVVVELTLDLPSEEAPPVPFSVETLDGRAVPVQVISREPYAATVEGGCELPLTLQVQRVRALLDLSDLPALGYETFAIKPGKAAERQTGASIVKSNTRLENERLIVDVGENGTLRLTDKRTSRTMDRLCAFEDSAEFGDPWNRVVPDGDATLDTLGLAARSEIDRDGPLEGRLKVTLDFPLPVGKADDAGRAAETVSIPITLAVSLKKGSPMLEVTVDLDNRAKDHRLRILFPSGLPKAEFSFAEGQFDVLRRPIRVPDGVGWKEPPYATHPMWNFVDVSDDENGLAILNDGLTEYEVVDDEPRTIAVTLLRAFGKFVFGRPTPEAQCLGRHRYRFAVYPHRGPWRDADLFRRTAEHLVPVQALESAPTRGPEKPRRSFLSLSSSSVVFSGMKQGEDGQSLVLRFWNPLDTPQEVSLHTVQRIRRAERITLEEKPVGPLAVSDGHSVTLTAEKKKIVTVGLWLEA